MLEVRSGKLFFLGHIRFCIYVNICILLIYIRYDIMSFWCLLSLVPFWAHRNFTPKANRKPLAQVPAGQRELR